MKAKAGRLGKELKKSATKQLTEDQKVTGGREGESLERKKIRQGRRCSNCVGGAARIRQIN